VLFLGGIRIVNVAAGGVPAAVAQAYPGAAALLFRGMSLRISLPLPGSTAFSRRSQRADAHI